jgi:hypothetical protein
MRRYRILLPVAALAAVTALAGCSDLSLATAQGLPDAGPAQPSSTDAPPDPGSATTADPGHVPSIIFATPDGSTQPGHAVSDLLRGLDRIDSSNAPAALPAWTARIQTMDDWGGVIDKKWTNLAALVDEAAREHDTAALSKLSGGMIGQEEMSAPDAFEQLAGLIEKTHAFSDVTSGLVYPGFVLTKGEAPLDQDDLYTFGIAPKDYTGFVVMFGAEKDQPLTLLGLEPSTSF